MAYTTQVWRYPEASKWHSTVEADIPAGSGIVEASADFLVPQIDASFDPDRQNYPNIQVGADPPPYDPMDETNVLSPEGWIPRSGWVVWARWRFFNGVTEVQTSEATVPPGTFRGPDYLVDPLHIHNLLIPAGTGAWTYEMQVPAEVTRMTVDLEYDGESLGDGGPGYGAKSISHVWLPDQPDSDWPYRDPELSGGGGDAGVFKVG